MSANYICFTLDDVTPGLLKEEFHNRRQKLVECILKNGDQVTRFSLKSACCIVLLLVIYRFV